MDTKAAILGRKPDMKEQIVSRPADIKGQIVQANLNNKQIHKR